MKRMVQQQLINDANILIDIEVANLRQELFRLPYVFVVPDALFEEELRAHHAELLNLGLQCVSLASGYMPRWEELVKRYGAHTSVHDCLALAVAEQERCPLLSGDRHLRQAAEQEGVEVRGTLWLIEEMVSHAVIDLARAYAVYDQLETAQRRLPFKQARTRLTDRFAPPPAP